MPPRDIDRLRGIKDSCDKCPYIPKNLADFLEHLDNAHPEDGKATAW